MELWKNLLAKAYEVATRSPDPSTQNGAIIVDVLNVCAPRDTQWHKIIGEDCNRFPDRIEHTEERLYTPLKYLYVEHAEFGAIFNTMKEMNVGNLAGYTMVCPWAACTGCAKTIERSGIRRLVRHKQAHLQSAGNTKWAEEIRHADILMREVGIEIIEYDGKVDGPPVLHGGKIWHP